MITVSADEYLCYGESSTGQYTPLIGVPKLGNSLAFREVVKEDLARIYDEETIPGSWIFRKTISSSGTWVKRFAIIRGSFIFLFHSPQNEKPLAIIPLEGCRVVQPESAEKSFEEQRFYTANDGYEFDIRHPSRPTVRLYALSLLEREEWVTAVTNRVSLPGNLTDMPQLSAVLKQMPPGSNITVSNTKLVGLSYTGLDGDDFSGSGSPTQPVKSAVNYNNPFAPPRIPEYEDAESIAGGDGGGGNGGGDSYNVPAGLSPAHSMLAGSSFRSNVGAPPPQPPLPSTYLASQPPESLVGSPPPSKGPGSVRSVPSHLNSSHITVKKLDKAVLETKFKTLEVDLGRIVSEQQAARDRENAVRAKMTAEDEQRHATMALLALGLSAGGGDTIDDAIAAALGGVGEEELKEAQAKQSLPPKTIPLSLAEVFRLMLYFFDEELAEDPQPNSNLDFPHAKGSAIDSILVGVYQCYCLPTGFMTLETLVEFLDEAAILQTHVPHNDNDEPLEEFKDALDAITLLRSLPRQYHSNSSLTLGGGGGDRLSNIDFGQFYQLLVRISQIIYPDLFISDRTVAFAKLLSEILVPLYPWCRAKFSKRMIHDPVLREERILLVLTAYAPNLWKVFLSYAADAVGKIPEIALPFPETAQLNERGMYRLGTSMLNAIPQRLHPSVAPGQGDSWLMTDVACLRFARDYGLTPHVISSKQLRDAIKVTNRQKVIISSRLPSRDQLNATSAAAGAPKPPRANSITSSKMGGEQQPPLPSPPPPMYFGAKKDPRQVAAAIKQSSSSAPVSPQKAGGEEGGGPPPSPPGLSFSEFVELIARIAVEGMAAQPNFHVVFPTPFSKVLALLTVWGIADLRKLEEVRTIKTEEAYN